MQLHEPGLYGRLREALTSSWRLKARPEQLPPPGDWSVWLLMAGRGFGKTRSGAECVQEWVSTGQAKRIGLIGPTAGDTRDTMVEGASGLLTIAPDRLRPIYEPSKRKVSWPNGSVATLFSAEEPDRLRGPEHDAIWADELGAWKDPSAWDMAMMGLRIGRARAVITTTPKPTRLVRELLAREGGDVVVTRGRTMDNAANLSPQFLEAIEKRYGGTRIGKQELEGQLLEDVEGALWRRAWIDQDRVTEFPDLCRVVVAVDPAVSTGEGSDETGIIVAGLGTDGHYYVIDDCSGRLSPIEWARTAISGYRRHSADRIVAEVNNGGQLVEQTLRNVDQNVSYKEVHASRGKAVRAEPCSALYEQHRVHHVGSFDTLEEQMYAFTSDFDRRTAGYSPDRVDALVWALTELGGRRMFVVTPDVLARFSQPRLRNDRTASSLLKGIHHVPI